MTRQLLRQALAVLQDVNIDAMDRSMVDRVSDTAFAIFTALLHTPEPASVLWVMTTPIGGRKFVIESESEAKRFAAMGDRSVVPFYAPDTLTQSTHEADMSKKNADIDRLHEYFTNMTAQRDWMAMRFDALEAGSAADRLDAQRYRWLRQDTHTSAVPRVWRSNESAEPTKCLDGSKLDDEIDQAVKGGQP